MQFMTKEKYKNGVLFYKDLWKEHKKKIIIIFLLSSIKICVTLLLPIISMKILDSAIPNHNLKEVLLLSISILSFAIIQALMDYAVESIYANLGKIIYLKYQKNVLEHFMRLSGNYYSDMKFGEVYNTIYEDIERIQGLVSGNVFQFIVNVISAVGVLFILVKMQWDLALLLIIILPIIYCCQRYFQTRGRSLSKVLRNEDGELIGILEDIISNIIPFHYSHSKKFFFKRYAHLANKSKNSEVKLQLLSVKNRGILGFLAQLFSIIVIGYGGIKVISGNLTIGGLIAFNMYGNQMVSPILSISGVLMYLQTNFLSLDRVHEFLNQKEIEMNINGIKLDAPEQIEFNNIDFTYGNDKILKNLSAKFSINRLNMIVGESGSGKSTILNILYRLWDIEKGTIDINGIKIDQYNVDGLREKITIVSQDMYLFNDTVFNNLVLGQNKSEEEIIKALQIACVEHVIKALPNGYNTKLGENGIKFSGGERQRICLARAILRNSPILILDEATSALDQVTEEKILLNIKSNIKDKIIIMITHRMENCKYADNIIVLKEGETVGYGTHNELIKESLYYKNLYHRSII